MVLALAKSERSVLKADLGVVHFLDQEVDRVVDQGFPLLVGVEVEIDVHDDGFVDLLESGQDVVVRDLLSSFGLKSFNPLKIIVLSHEIIVVVLEARLLRCRWTSIAAISIVVDSDWTSGGRSIRWSCR